MGEWRANSDVIVDAAASTIHCASASATNPRTGGHQPENWQAALLFNIDGVIKFFGAGLFTEFEVAGETSSRTPSLCRSSLGGLPQVCPRCVGGRGATWSRFVVFLSFSLFLLSGLVLRRFGLVDLQRVQGSLPVRLARFGVVRGVTRGISSLALVRCGNAVLAHRVRC